MTPLTEQDGNNARWLDWLLALAVALAYTALALPGLAEPAKPIFDEILHVFAANDWLRDMPMS
ncbi:MAG: hypothetical protein VKP62_06595, partial [Candidatus Sericytochromatia bacterium]|nr:hypothetical protein [Candidatus Sericytochromatia bacterium]